MKLKIKEASKNIGGGIAVGVANIIPGVSGGTMLVILGIFDRLMASISDVFKVHSEDRKGSILFLLQVLLGAGIGLVAFAKVVDWLFTHYATQTFFWFIGLVLLSIPTLIKKELKGHKISIPYLVLGIVVIGLISFIAPEKADLTITAFPQITLIHLITMIGVGAISGATMLFPGVSGSMIMLIIGQYYLFKSYVANVTSFEMVILIPLAFLAFGIFLGILISAKLTSYLLEGYRGQTVSLILGLILASAVVLIPTDVIYTLPTVLTSLLSFVVGGLVVVVIDKFN